MPIHVECETCGKVLRARDEAAGKTTKCPDCGAALVIPMPQATSAESSPESGFGGSNGASGQSGDAVARDLKPCPMCGEMIKRAATKCRYCGEVIEATGALQIGRPGLPIAGLGSRFAASMVDSFAGILVCAPGFGMYLAGGAEVGLERGDGMALTGILLLLLGGLGVFVANMFLLVKRSQTIGKMALKIQIREFETGQRAGFVKSFLLRAVVNGLIGSVPCVGPIYSIVDIFYIFTFSEQSIVACTI